MRILGASSWLLQKYGPPYLALDFCPCSLSLCFVFILGAIFFSLLVAHAPCLRHKALMLLWLGSWSSSSLVSQGQFSRHKDPLLFIFVPRRFYLIVAHSRCSSHGALLLYFLRHNDLLLLFLDRDVCVAKLFSCMLLEVQCAVSAFVL